MTANKKIYLYWLYVFVLQLLLIGWYRGWFNDHLVVHQPPSSKLQMSKEESRLTRNGIGRVRDDLIAGNFAGSSDPVRSVINALSYAVPKSVNAVVMKEFGTPDMTHMEKALDNLEEKLP